MTDGQVDRVSTDEDVLAEAEALCRDAADELRRSIDAIRDGDYGEVESTQEAVRELRATASLVLMERGRVDRFHKQGAGQVGGGGAIDFDAARAEIGRRLACLRERGGRD